MSTVRLASLLLFASLLLAVGCSDSTGPIVDDDAVGTIDPGGETFTVKTMTATPPDGEPVPLILESTGVMSMDDGMTVVLEVTVRNAGDRSVGAPLIIWINGLDPADVSVANPDIVAPGLPGEPMLVGFDYSELLGPDGVLEPGETTTDKVWEFLDPGQGPFSFSGYAEGGFGPSPARLGGLCFEDVNQDGELSPDEGPFPMAFIHVIAPDGHEVTLHTGPDGRYGMRVFTPGLYTLKASSPTMDPLGFRITTANPLHVVLTPGPDGTVQGYVDADFGFVRPWLPPPPESSVMFTDIPADSLHVRSWTFLEANVEIPGRLNLHVGYSGCEPVQAFSCFALGGFMESMPPQLDILPVHSEEQDCDAIFEHTYGFDLMHVHRAYMEAYGPGPLILNIVGLGGEIVGSVETFIGLD